MSLNHVAIKSSTNFKTPTQQSSRGDLIVLDEFSGVIYLKNDQQNYSVSSETDKPLTTLSSGKSFLVAVYNYNEIRVYQKPELNVVGSVYLNSQSGIQDAFVEGERIYILTGKGSIVLFIVDLTKKLTTDYSNIFLDEPVPVRYNSSMRVKENSEGHIYLTTWCSYDSLAVSVLNA